MPATNVWTPEGLPAGNWAPIGPPTDRPVFSGLVFSAKVFSTLVRVYPTWTTKPQPPDSIWTVEP